MDNQLMFNGFSQSLKSTDWKWTISKDYPQEKHQIRVFSCFSCGGGSTMGYKLAGCEVIGNCEIDKQMNEVYVKNHHPKFNYCMDIRDFNNLPDDELPEELFNLDILDGSPPCTTFSMAGDREDTWGKKKKFREGQAEQTLDDLSFVFIETVRKLKPKCVIMENVEGLLLGAAWTYVQRIYKEFMDAGYQINHYLCKGEQMGVPQNRHRVFFIAFRSDVQFDFYQLNMCFDYEHILYGDIKEGIGAELVKDTQQYRMLCQAEHCDHSIGDVLERTGHKKRCFNDKIIWEDEVCCTIPGKCNIMRGTDKTKISKEDIIHAQTFPEDYDFNGCNVGYICGMSVPPVMIKRIVNRLIDTGVFDNE